MIKKDIRNKLISDLCQLRQQQAAEQSEAAEGATRQAIMISTVKWQFEGLLSPAEAQRLRDEALR